MTNMMVRSPYSLTALSEDNKNKLRLLMGEWTDENNKGQEIKALLTPIYGEEIANYAVDMTQHLIEGVGASLIEGVGYLDLLSCLKDAFVWKGEIDFNLLLQNAYASGKTS